MFGRGYVIEHCVSTFLRYKKEQTYRSYVSNALKVLTENTSRYIGLNGMVECGGRLTLTYDEIIGNTKTEERTADEVIETIKQKIEGLGDEP